MSRPPMKSTLPVRAYLVLWIDTTMPGFPRVVDAGIYSEKHPSTTSFAKRFPVAVMDHQGSTFEGAKENLRRHCSAMPYMRWALKYFDK